MSAQYIGIYLLLVITSPVFVFGFGLGIMAGMPLGFIIRALK